MSRLHEHTVIDLPKDDPIGGPYCIHVMVAAWCAICRHDPDLDLYEGQDL